MDKTEVSCVFSILNLNSLETYREEEREGAAEETEQQRGGGGGQGTQGDCWG